MTRDSERAALRPDIGSDVASSKAPADAAPQPRLRSGRGFGISVLFAVAGQCTITPFFCHDALLYLEAGTIIAVHGRTPENARAGATIGDWVGPCQFGSGAGRDSS